MEVETTQAILCIGEWCKEGVINNKDVLVAVKGVPDDVEDVDKELGIVLFRLHTIFGVLLKQNPGVLNTPFTLLLPSPVL